jgi:hypothetical protein
MGYTNYFHIKPCKKEFSPCVLGKVKKILSTYEALYSESLVKGFFHRNEKPTVTKDLIQFNTPSEDTGEDFYIDLTEGCSGFCKTCRETYDAAVKAVLMVLQSAGYLIKWNFDGGVYDTEYDAGIQLLAKAGIKYNDRMQAMR